MKVTFLEAEVPLTKTFYLKDGKIEKIGHPRILDYTSHVEEIKDLQQLHTSLVSHAAAGHCFLKGNVSRPLVKEPRAGTTNPSEETEILLLDIDGVKGVDTVEEFLIQTKLAGSDYIVQYSSSMGVLPGRGMSAHVFIWLDKAYAPAILKQYLYQWNLAIPILQSNLGLTRTYNALRWSLDVTTCQADKLIYIAPPLLKDGVQDTLEGERIRLVVGKKRRLSLPDPFPNAEANAAKTQEKLNELRKVMGLKERPKTTMRVAGSVEYMAKPDRAVVTGIKEGADFTHLNLNGGDSWGYYHPTHNPEFIYNFKNEPVYRTSELLPDYWSEVKQKMNEVRPDADGKVYLAFRDFRTGGYYNGVFDTKGGGLVKFAQAKGSDQLRDFLRQYSQPVPEFFTDWDVGFDPHSELVVDPEARKINTYQPSVYMRMKPRKQKVVPPGIRRLVLHALGGDEDVLEHFLNWFAVIVQHKVRTGTAWVLHGRTGTGKGLMLDSVLRPILGMEYVQVKRIREIDSQFNGFMEKSFLLWVDEAEQNDFNMRGSMNADIKNFITEPRISIRKMHTLPYEVNNYLNWILASNKGHIIEIDPQDRRFNVAVYQPEELVIDDAGIRALDDELVDFYHYIATRKADKALARVPLNNAAKQKMILLNQASVDVAADAILTGNLDFFRQQMPQVDIEVLPALEREKARRYVMLMGEIVAKEPSCILREELQVLLEYTVGNMPASSVKFSSFLKHHKLHIVPVSRGGATKRGIPVKWQVDPEWKK